MENREEKLINARKLKEIVGNKSDFSDWIKRNIKKNRFKEKQDYLKRN